MEVRDGLVAAVGLGDPPRDGDAVAVPGLVDLQVNGYRGVDFAVAEREGYERAGRALLAAGTTAYLPTLISAPPDATRRALAAMPALGSDTGPRVIGAHLEGPFLSPSRMGIHDRSFQVMPDLALLRKLLDGGPVARVTLAPELPGALELIDELCDRGIAVACGHTEATAEQAHMAFDRGVRSVTHLYNAMPAGTARAPSIVTAALAREDVAVELIVDGFHLAPDTVLATWRAAAGRLALVSDATAAAGAGPGDFTIGGRPVHAREDGMVTGEDGQLAGSALSLLSAVRNLHALGVPLEQALSAATAVPAALCGRPELGELKPGSPADVVVLDGGLAVKRVLVDGEPAFEQPG